ncbi:hypothetical protein GUJ93_ZPchr0006g41922 [Zizania palustris]|uniref:Glabrous enhancer-binding protein-like DBD domain-containing protein n=1 Tax=Zizania palustris TaxID=103762 RepID=A0A8J5T8S1_ZIZPA|nr:hypothetical protein GUJ93_ZPchr0006g41922 [Zizania palustris]
MPSKRPSLSAMDAAGAAPASPSPPRSKKRSSRPKPRAGDGRPVPNPSATAPAPAPVPAAAAAASSSRNRERERKRRARGAFADPAAVTAPAGSSHGAVQKLWSDADEIALLAGAADFRARTGNVPRLPDMGPLFDSIRGSLSPHLDQAKVYYKLKRLKSKYLHAAPGASAGPHERRVRDLCASVWGADLEPLADGDDEGGADQRRTVPDAAAMLPVLTEMLDEYWKTDGRSLSGVSLEKGLSLLGTDEARFIEAKWRRQLDAEIQTQIRRHDLAKEVYGLLMDAIKGLGP